MMMYSFQNIKLHILPKNIVKHRTNLDNFTVNIDHDIYEL